VALVAAVLKAYRGVHEVITTIMLNSIVIALSDYLTSNPFKEPDQPLTRTPKIQDSAQMPDLLGLPLGFFSSYRTFHHTLVDHEKYHYWF